MLKRIGLRRKSPAKPQANPAAMDALVFSLSTAVPRPPAELPADGRDLDLLPVARLSSPRGYGICRIRAVSAGGLVADTPSTIDIGASVTLDVAHAGKVTGKVVWTRQGMAGIKFDENVDVRALMPNHRLQSGERPRQSRIEIRCTATVSLAGKHHRTEIRDISLGGLRLDIGDANWVGQRVALTVESLRPVRGVVRWHRNGQTGILFDAPLSFEELSEWIGKRYEVASRRAIF